jgi:hypothetical protein
MDAIVLSTVLKHLVHTRMLVTSIKTKCYVRCKDQPQSLQHSRMHLKEASTTAEKQRTLEGGNVNKSPPAAAILLNEDQDASSGDERAAGVDVGDEIPSLASRDGRKTNRGKAT